MTRPSSKPAQSSSKPAGPKASADKAKADAAPAHVAEVATADGPVEVAVQTPTPSAEAPEVKASQEPPSITTNVQQGHEPGKDESVGDQMRAAREDGDHTAGVAVAVPVAAVASPMPHDAATGEPNFHAPTIPPAPPMPIPPDVPTVLAEVPFGQDPDDIDDAASLDTTPGMDTDLSAKVSLVEVVYEGIADSPGPHPPAVSIIVPVDPKEDDYAGAHSQGTSYTLRLGRPTKVRSDHVKWLEGYPAYSIRKAKKAD